jgi:hypothetical protein
MSNVLHLHGGAGRSSGTKVSPGNFRVACGSANHTSFRASSKEIMRISERADGANRANTATQNHATFTKVPLRATAAPQTSYADPSRRVTVRDRRNRRAPQISPIAQICECAVRTLFALFSTGAGHENASRLDTYAIMKLWGQCNNFRVSRLRPIDNH